MGAAIAGENLTREAGRSGVKAIPSRQQGVLYGEKKVAPMLYRPSEGWEEFIKEEVGGGIKPSFERRKGGAQKPEKNE